VNPGRRLIREPDVDNPRQYRRRVRQLAVAYLLLVTLAVTGIWRGSLTVNVVPAPTMV